MARLFQYIAAPVSICTLWWAMTALHMINPLFLPEPGDTLRYALKLIGPDGWAHWTSTLMRTLGGFFLAAALAIPLGLFVGYVPVFYRYLESSIDFFRSLPGSALFPLFLLYFGIGDCSKVALIAFTGFWVMFVATLAGVWNVEPVKLRLAHTYRASRAQTMWYILLPAATPLIVNGFRTALPLCLIVSIVTEMLIGTDVGLGQVIYDGYITYQTAHLFGAILVAGMLGVVLNKSLSGIARRTIHWAT